MRTVIMPSDSLNERIPDEAFSNEIQAFRDNGIPISLLNHSSLDSPEEVEFKKLPEPGSTLFYRGWMVTVDEYTHLHQALQKRGLELFTIPSNYRRAHYLPGWYYSFQDITAPSVVLPPNPSKKAILRKAETLGANSAFIVKDFVKSRKYEWDTACYAPTLHQLPEIVAEFIRLQEDYLVGSVVVRKFLELDKSTPEVRVWWVNGAEVLTTVHPDTPDERIETVPGEFLHQVKTNVEELGAPFITTDLAKKTDGTWTVIEVGDGQVSGLPSTVTEEEITQLFTALHSGV